MNLKVKYLNDASQCLINESLNEIQLVFDKGDTIITIKNEAFLKLKNYAVTMNISIYQAFKDLFLNKIN